MTFLTLVSTECIRRLNEWNAPSIYSKSFSVAAMEGWGVTVLKLAGLNKSLCALCIAFAVAIIASEPSFKWMTSFSRLWMRTESTSYPVLDLFCCAPASSKICFVCQLCSTYKQNHLHFQYGWRLISDPTKSSSFSSATHPGWWHTEHKDHKEQSGHFPCSL